GDCSQAPVAVLTCTALGLDHGRVPGRAGAKPGDRILVTGSLGGAVSSGAHRCPEPRLKQGRRFVERYAPHAMMDLSDGLAKDLPRILHASGVGARIELDHLPLTRFLKPDRCGYQSAVGEGEDYELLVVLSPRQTESAVKDRLLRSTGITDIGLIVEGKGLDWLQDGQQVEMHSEGWEVSWP
ncbi:MAG: thiamine-phosphate kinase, partial [Planctomycetota bacterium]